MKLPFTLLLAACNVVCSNGKSHVAFVFPASRTSEPVGRSHTSLCGYLDDLNQYLKEPEPEVNPEEESREATQMAADQIDRFGPGNLADFVDFDEFDGGDGQQGCVGDGNNALEKIGEDYQATIIKPTSAQVRTTSRERSAKNAWGTSTGYAEQLRSQGVDTARAQQIENWQNQQELTRARRQNQYMTEQMDKVSDHDEDWRTLVKFGGGRVEDFNLDTEFGPVAPGDQLEGEIVLKSLVGRASTFEMSMNNPYMGFADFRAAFTPETPMDWTVTPKDGSLSKNTVTNFVVRFSPQNPGLTQGYLVIETEDFKKTWRVVGTTG